MLISKSSVFSFSRTVSVFAVTTVSFRAVLSQDSSPQLSGPPVLASCYVLIVLARLSCPECSVLAILSRLYFVVPTWLNCVDFLNFKFEYNLEYFMNLKLLLGMFSETKRNCFSLTTESKKSC
jgi:hypothetical protein